MSERITSENLDRVIKENKKISQIIENYCKEDFCHRHLVADWFSKYAIGCKEFSMEELENG